MTKQEDDASGDEAALRASLKDDAFKPDTSGVRFGLVQPKILVAGAYKVIRTAAERAREVMGRSR